MLTGGIHNSSIEKIDSLAALKSIRPELVNQADLQETHRAKELNFLKLATPVLVPSLQDSSQTFDISV
ncbi:MAG: hypothetical protein IPJ39_00505 [Saprospiraceae bacterium]|nr:hypothetical protein [Saprospiraceae bacterium]